MVPAFPPLEHGVIVRQAALIWDGNHGCRLLLINLRLMYVVDLDLYVWAYFFVSLKDALSLKGDIPLFPPERCQRKKIHHPFFEFSPGSCAFTRTKHLPPSGELTQKRFFGECSRLQSLLYLQARFTHVYTKMCALVLFRATYRCPGMVW